jgi:hypothetical protein
VSLRIPKALYEQAQQYAMQRRLTLTELLLDGLKLRLETPADPRELFLSDNRNTVIQKLRDELKGTLLDELRKDVQTLLASTVQAGLTQSQHTALPSPTPDLPLTPHDVHPTQHDMRYDRGNTVLRKSSPHDFDTTKYRLGKLCPQGHAWGTTGQSLLRQKQGDCPDCEKLAKRQKRQRAKAQARTP